MNVSREGLLNLKDLRYVGASVDERRLRRGDVLFNNTNSPELVGKTCAIKTDADLAFSNHMTRLRPAAGMSASFIAYQLHYLWMSGFFRHRCVKHVNQASVASSVLAASVPMVVAPSREQARLAEALDVMMTSLDDAAAALGRAQRKLNRYRVSVLQAAVEGRLVPTEVELARAEGREYEPAPVLLERVLAGRRGRWEEAEVARLRAAGNEPRDDRWKAKYKEPQRPNSGELAPLPEGWCWATLPQLGELNRGKSRHRPRNDPRLLGGPYPFIQTGDVRRAHGFIETFEDTYSEFGLAQSRLWPAGTLCITIAANIAETGILRFAACFPDSVVGFLNSDEPVLVRYIELFIRTAREKLATYAPATAQKNINLETLSEIVIPLAPACEQERIVREVDRLFSVVAKAEVTLQLSARRSDVLRRSILRAAFGGELVDQEPTDEPAEMLLQSIRKAREANRQVRPASARPRSGMHA
jgi:type I restriction enzyme S subunit